jgi:chromosome segregation ATPase
MLNTTKSAKIDGGMLRSPPYHLYEIKRRNPMADDQPIGIFAALWRYVSFYKLRQALGLVRAADAQFTGSADGISDAYDLQREKLVTEYKQFMSALAEVESAVEQKRERVKVIKQKKKESEKALEGALAVYEKAQAANDQKTMTEAERDGEGFRQEVNRLTEQETELENEIADQEHRLGDLEGRLTAMQREIANLTTEKADAIADFVSNKNLMDAHERLMGLKSRMDSGPIDAVRKANRDLAAKARVAGRLSGADADHVKDKYVHAGEDSVAGNEFQKMVAARKAQKEQSTGTAPAAEKEDRPKI